jgi:arylsulfatase A-like enzyme
MPLLAALPVGCISQNSSKQETEKPNVVIILADDLGYGDIGSYGATAVKTPNLDRLAAQGLRFTNAYCTSATSTPSRYSMLTGEYAWRREGTGIAPGDAAALILPGRITLPSVFNNAGYATGVVGKWHLGLGPAGGPDWNGEIAPGPLDIGFDYCFLIPATGDRVPCVYVENRRVVGLDPADPVSVSFGEKIGNEPTGRENPELLKLHPSHGHDMTIVNGISRIGYMTGGKTARWVDEDMAQTITGKAKEFIAGHKNEPFLLYFATQDIHVPRAPDQKFAGKSGLGARGDVILQFDWAVGEIMKTLDSLKLSENTILIITSDNGPVVDDGYKDEAVEKLSGHKPAGPLRGGKYSAFDGGTRIPFIISWNGKIKPGVSSAMISQIDLLASFASLTGQEIPENSATDSYNNLQVLLGKSDKDRDFVVEHALNGTLSVIKGTWKYIEPSDGPKININTNTELGNDPEPQLYDLEHDTGEMNNLATKNPDKVKELSELLNQVKKGSRTF